MDSAQLDELERLSKRVDPLPWKLNLHIGKVVRYTEHGNERFIADCLRVTKRDAHCKSNAAYIVAACNSLPDLIAELKEARSEKAAFKSWQTGTPSASGFYWVKYKGGSVDVIELEWRRMQWAGSEPRTYLGLAGHIMRPFEDEEDIVAWAGPLPMPEEKEAVK